MADISPTVTRSIDPDNGTTVKVTWNALAGVGGSNNVGVATKMLGFADRCVEVRGTFDGSIVVLEGSNGGTSYFTLTNPAGSALSFSAAGLKQVVERPQFVRPNVSNNGNNAAIVVDLVMCRANPYTR